MTQPSQSEWATKYGTINPGDTNSGYSPVALKFPTVGASTQSFRDNAAIEVFQKRELYGFTTSELARLDCLPTRDLKPGNLQNDIHPVFHRDRWEVEPLQPDFMRADLYPVKNAIGEWTATNDEVWRIMQSPLLLASRMLMSVHILPWFDALMYGERVNVPIDRFKPEDLTKNGQPRNLNLYQTFWPRKPESVDIASVASARNTVLQQLMTNHAYMFGFMDTDIEHPDDSGEEDFCHGLTFTNHWFCKFDKTAKDKKLRVFSFLDVNILEHLFDPDLKSAERMQIDWHVANTLVHEVMHAIHLLRSDLIGQPNNVEPYFMLEPISELGFSYEKAMSIGQTEQMIRGEPSARGLPFGFWHRAAWPDALSLTYEANPDLPILINPGVALVNQVFPIPLTFYEDMQQEEFWVSAVAGFGLDILKYRTVKEGAELTYKMAPSEPTGIQWTRQERFSLREHPFQVLNDAFCASIETLKDAASLTPTERQMIAFGKSFVLSSNLEQKFWDDSEEQKNQIDEMNLTIDATIKNTAMTRGDRDMLHTGMLGFASQAMSNHDLLIANIMSMESANNTIYTGRRLAVREWNRGTRVFLRRLDNMLKRSGQNAERELLYLERARMVLWDPADLTTQDGFDWTEMQQIRSMDGLTVLANNVQIRKICDTLLDAPEVSLVAECYARLHLFEMDKAFFEGWQTRYKHVVKASARLEFLCSAAPPAWRDEMNQLRATCRFSMAAQIPPAPLPPSPGAESDSDSDMEDLRIPDPMEVD